MGKVATDAPANKPSDYLKYDKGSQYWTIDPFAEALLQTAETGWGSSKLTPQTTIPELFEQAVKKNGNKVALRTENMPPLQKGQEIPGPIPLKDWKSWTYKQYYNDCRSFGKALVRVGFQPHDSCNVFGFNSPEWFISMFGAIFAGGKVAGIYPSDNEEQVQYKSNHSNGAVAVVETAENLQKFKVVAKDLPYLKAIVTWACEPGDDIKRDDGGIIKTYSFQEFVALGEKQEDAALEKRLADQKPGHCCALIYTSGTTGQPKAVMISHDNLVYESFAVVGGSLDNIATKNEEERILSYLPLSHVAGMMVDTVCPVVISANPARMKGWASVNFARPYDLKRSTIGDRLKTVRPTLFLGVPRVWEKIMEKLKKVGAQTKGLKKVLATAAKKRSAIFQQNQQLGGSGGRPKTLAFYMLLLNKIKGALGLDKAKFVFAGAAPMTTECLEYFGSIGFNINEVYGMSECTGACTWSSDKYHTWGSVGYELPGTEVRIFKIDASGNKTESPAAHNLFAPTEDEQGEICFRGRNIMMGYMANPRLGKAHIAEIEKKNAEAIDAEGWLHSGDKGTKDIHGMVKITGRYKELIIGAGGENIAPVPIEDEIKRLAPYISNVMMIGNKRKFNVCVVTLKAKGATGELPGGNDLDGEAATLSKSKTITEAMQDKAFIQAITSAIEAANNNKKVVPSNAAKIQKFTILPRDFSVKTGELTATLKLKRSVVDDVYKPIIDAMYESKAAYVPYSTAPTPGIEAEAEVEFFEPPDKDRQLSVKFSPEEQTMEAEYEVEAAAAGDDKDE